jgi:hypothetical protein
MHTRVFHPKKNPASFPSGGRSWVEGRPLGPPVCPGSNQLLVKTCGAVTSGAFAATVLASPNMSAIAKTTLKAVFMAPTPKSTRGGKCRARG